MYQIVYEKHESGNYHVSLLYSSQTISLRPGYLAKIARIDERVEIGCREVPKEVLIELGFIFPSMLLQKSV